MTRLRPASVVCGLLGLLLLAGTGCDGPRRYDPASAHDRREAMEARIAKVLAEEAKPLLHESARVAVVFAGPDTNFGAEHARILSALRAVLGKQGAELLEWPLAAAAGRISEGAGYEPPPADLTGVWLARQLKEHPDVGVILSLADAPADEAQRLPPELPPLVCLAQVNGRNIAPLMRAGRIAAAIVPRQGAPPAKKKDWFDLRFELVRPDTVADWEQRRGGAQP